MPNSQHQHCHPFCWGHLHSIIKFELWNVPVLVEIEGEGRRIVASAKRNLRVDHDRENGLRRLPVSVGLVDRTRRIWFTGSSIMMVTYYVNHAINYCALIAMEICVFVLGQMDSGSALGLSRCLSVMVQSNQHCNCQTTAAGKYSLVTMHLTDHR